MDSCIKNYKVYLLNHTIHNRTYLGITNNPNRRIRQHNNLIKGGAKYTTSFKQNGEWKFHLFINDLTKIEALSIERTAKNIRRKSKGKTPLERRIYALNKVLEQKFPNKSLYYV